MCTSFVHRGKDTIIAMNFDNNGMNYSVSTKDPQWFVALVDGGRGKYPSFGFNSEGVFFNSLLVDSNGKGQYRRPSSKVTHITKLITDILNGVISADDLGDFLEKVEVVNTPGWSCHSMICDSNSNSWIIEPGRGNIYDAADKSPYTIMTNFSLCDCIHLNIEPSCNRYNTVLQSLKSSSVLDIAGAFNILESVSQKSGEWITALSIVYSKNNKRLYYCHNGNFDDV